MGMRAGALAARAAAVPSPRMARPARPQPARRRTERTLATRKRPAQGPEVGAMGVLAAATGVAAAPPYASGFFGGLALRLVLFDEVAVGFYALGVKAACFYGFLNGAAGL